MEGGTRRKISQEIDSDSNDSVSLPQDILIDILSRLSVKLLLQCKCVSKYWLKLITSHDFIKLQVDHANKNNPRFIFTATNSRHPSTMTLFTLDYEAVQHNAFVSIIDYNCMLSGSFKIVGSCNGLVCLSDYQTCIALCNPATREIVLEPFSIFGKLPDQFVLGFGYDFVKDVYKVVRFDICWRRSDEKDDCQLFVYTVGTKSWRKIPTPGRFHFSHNVPYMNGALHWFKLSTKCNPHLQPNFRSIISFDVGSEKSQKIPTVSFSYKDVFGFCLGVLQGCLSLCIVPNDKKQIDIWLMKEYGVKESWTKLFSFNYSPMYARSAPLVVRKNGEVLIAPDRRSGAINTDRASSLHMYSYDPTSKTLYLCLYTIRMWNSVSTYAESLVSIASFSGR
ncbi:hypothetical protein AQUCO_01000342v1 [Aquilegia coerulea]|uniref:F-box domain-containing protein n=1 Tax=Aquilegia coerulea TaxID=218851 RepID=A0A2G5E9J6_AQUCA|nr:hypothetical protein AQUCO_01000342v1 [Aquilegia coerulea]